jgi:prophage regulatory protein
MATQAQSAKTILRRVVVEQRLGFSRSTIYSRINPKSPHYDATFPKPIAMGNGSNPPVGWIESEIDAWLDAQIAKRGAQ